MSNHCGSYLLNAVLKKLDRRKVFATLGKEETLKFVNEIINLSDQADCNSGEILEDIGIKLGICYECYKYKDNLEEHYGVCHECRSQWRKPADR